MQRHDISRLPEVEGDKPAKKTFKAYPLGYFRCADLRFTLILLRFRRPKYEEGQKTVRGTVFPTIGCITSSQSVRCPAGDCPAIAERGTSKFAFVELHRHAGKMAAAAFLRNLIAAVPCKLHIVLSEPSLVRHWFDPNGGGIQFTDHERHIHAFEHIFGRICREHQIDYRSAKIRHPLSRFAGKPLPGNATARSRKPLSNASTTTTTTSCEITSPNSRTADLRFNSAYNFGRRLKTLKGLTPYEFICKQWTTEPERFTLNPIHQMPGLNT